MESKGAAYDEAVKEAQRLGFAEANPTLDVNGSDATQKLAILAHLAFGAQVDWKTIPRVGVDVVSAIDVRFAKELGRKIRLLATARLVDGELELKVAPTLVPEDAALAKVTSAFNAIQIVGDFVGPLFYQGWGAGRRPTASAVCSDVIDAALGRVRITFDSLRLWSPERAGAKLRDSSKLTGRAYLRFVVEDRPGVMAEISSALGRRNISIAQMMQDSHDVSPYVSLIILTHEASSSALADALSELGAAPFIHGETTLLDVVD